MTGRSKADRVARWAIETDHPNSSVGEQPGAEDSVPPPQRRALDGDWRTQEIGFSDQRGLLEIGPRRYLRDDFHRLG